jgi:hypothetical protein
MAHVCGLRDRRGILGEILGALEQQGAKGADQDYDIEPMKLLLEQMCAAAGVRVRLHTRVVGASVDEGRRVRAAVTESKSGREAWRASVFVDCTGDGDLAALAGCGFDVGRPVSGEVQPMSFIAILGGVRVAEIRDFTNVRERRPGEGHAAHKEAFCRLLESLGVPPSYTHPTLFHVREDLVAMMSNHEYGRCGFDADDLTAATLAGRAEVFRQVAALRALGGPWAGVRIVATSDHIGVRECRRIHGRYTVTAADVAGGARFPDAAARSYFCVDVHSTNPERDKSLGNEGIAAKPFDIPVRALIARDVDGLMMAGRCISGDFIAHASYRVTSVATPMGEAAGRIAARAARNGRLPHEEAAGATGPVVE